MPPQPRHSTISFRAALARSFAYSHKLNPSNMEHDWYAFWNEILRELIDNHPNLLLIPQYSLWFIDEEEEDGKQEEGPDDDPDVRDAISPKALRQWKRAGNVEPEDEILDNTSFSSTRTIPKKTRKARITDFAIVYLVPDTNSHNLNPRYDNIWVTSVHVPIIIENKRYISRSIKRSDKSDSNFLLALKFTLLAASQDLCRQAACLFLKFDHIRKVTAIATCGPFWQAAEIRYGDISEEDWLIVAPNADYHPPSSNVDVVWSNTYEVGTAKSDRKFRAYRTILQGKPRVEF